MANTDTLPNVNGPDQGDIDALKAYLLAHPTSAMAPAPKLAAPTNAVRGPVPMGAAPEIAAGAPPTSLPSMGPAPMPVKPTQQASIAAGQAEHGTTAKQEGKNQFEEMKPQVTAAPGTPEFFQQKLAQEEYAKEHPLGADISARPGFLGKLEHFGAKVGNIAGDIVAPGVMQDIPGTERYNRLEEARNLKNFGGAEENQLRAAQNKEAELGNELIPWTNPQTGQTEQIERRQWAPIQTAETKAQGAAGIAGTKTKSAEEIAAEEIASREKLAGNKPPTSEQDKQFLATAGQQLDTGTISAADRTKLAGMQRAEKLSGLGPEVSAQIGNPPVPADFPKGTKDPAYVAANQKWGQQAEAIKNAEAGASGAARGAGFNASKPVEVLDADGNLRYMTAGEAEKQGLASASQGGKVMTRQAQFNDITNASQEVRKAIQAGGNLNFTPSQVAKLTLAMHEKDPDVLNNEIANLATSGLNPQQQDMVTWLYQLQERALSLRNIAGMGQGSETTRMAILKALPSLTSGNQQMALKQLDAFDNMTHNLQQAVPKAKGAPERTGEKKPTAAGAIPSFADFAAGNH